MKIKPIIHRVLVKPDQLEVKTESGIIIQYDKRENKAVETGVVCAIGSTVYREFGSSAEAEGLTIGSRVYFAKYSGMEVKIDEERYLLVNDEDLVGVIEYE